MPRATITCTTCKTAAAVPEDGDHSPLWDAGWRWIGTEKLFSCPDCPPLLLVDDQGRHLRAQHLSHTGL
ncbi:hypothetical protein [Streptomyces sp. 8L]|uniref:hypothetical protein n=1 Tax=Streptomyces sp. 8L TaxID=2877242 RepID=UPI001CD61015|nr:hypothetical protein [Streptomyces sp. 8L]MCA1223566.1 hypothetical protein [Streptomyces sp. 8L]